MLLTVAYSRINTVNRFSYSLSSTADSNADTIPEAIITSRVWFNLVRNYNSSVSIQVRWSNHGYCRHLGYMSKSNPTKKELMSRHNSPRSYRVPPLKVDQHNALLFQFIWSKSWRWISTVQEEHRRYLFQDGPTDTAQRTWINYYQRIPGRTCSWETEKRLMWHLVSFDFDSPIGWLRWLAAHWTPHLPQVKSCLRFPHSAFHVNVVWLWQISIRFLC